MKYGCIAERLGHSFSREIHNMIGDYEYELCELSPDELGGFMEKRDFLGINVTIPYKRDVIPYLSHIDEAAEKMGAVNTVVNRDGELWGYNTDFFGMRDLIESANIEINGKKVVVLGTGGTSHMANVLAASLGAREVVTASRTGKGGACTYEQIYERHTDADVIINTTPSGMYPKLVYEAPVDIARFPNVSAVVDAVYNPQRTRLVSEARKRNINAVGGLYMLVSQAVYASEHFFDKKYPDGLADDIYKRLSRIKENIVLTGMPGSGKSTLGRRAAEATGRRFVDTDAIFVERYGNISDFFAAHGEDEFRRLETEIVREAAMESECVIATGGGVILRGENVDALRQNGRIYYIDRPLSWLTPTSDRPLARDADAIKKRYHERHDIYLSTADCVIKPSSPDKDKAATMIVKAHMES